MGSVSHEGKEEPPKALFGPRFAVILNNESEYWKCPYLVDANACI